MVIPKGCRRFLHIFIPRLKYKVNEVFNSIEKTMYKTTVLQSYDQYLNLFVRKVISLSLGLKMSD